jgi:hypothetical protein
MDGAGAKRREREATRGRRLRSRLVSLSKPLGAALAIVGFVLWSHLGADTPVFRAQVSSAPGWDEFRSSYSVDDFGDDGYFVRAVQNGYNLFYFTHAYAWRFTRKTAADAVNACASCHTPEDLAHGFVKSDRFDAELGKRMSFEDRVMRCFAGPMQGFVPTLYDPTVRDLRILARAVAYHLKLSEGALQDGS